MFRQTSRLIDRCARLITYLDSTNDILLLTGHNWNDAQVLKVQKQNFRWFGWKTPAALSFAWQYSRDAEEESPESYRRAIKEFAALLKTPVLRRSA